MTKTREATPSHTWILVANAARALILETEPTRKHRRWQIVQSFEHPESREHVAELESDRPGLTMQGGTERRAALEHTSPKETEARHFAAEIARTLTEGRRTARFDALVLTAAPRFLGLLRAELPESVTERVRTTLDKDYTHLAPEQLQAQLGEFVGL